MAPPAAFVTPAAVAARRGAASSAFAGATRVGRPAPTAAVAPAAARGRSARLPTMKVTIEESELPNSMRGVTIHVTADEVAECYNKVRRRLLREVLGGPTVGLAVELDVGETGLHCHRSRDVHPADVGFW